jgi:hypothetical protein
MRLRRGVDDLSLKSQAILAATSIAFVLTVANSHVRESVEGSKLAWYNQGGSIIVNYLVLGIGRLVLLASCNRHILQVEGERRLSL